MTSKPIFALALAAIIWGYVVALQRPPPRYSQQYMPQTSFTCRNKIVGSYYADPETDCQLFHVCVSVAGSIQDYRFLCPNDTAFDQESQTCADWYDVDCEAATLYYASDNFDLYRIGSGLESLHYDSIRSDLEPQDHLQRSESNDPIRSPLNSLGSVSSYAKPSARPQIAKQYSTTTEAKPAPEPEKSKPAVRKQQSRKPSGFSSVYQGIKQTPVPTPTSTAAPVTTPIVYQQQHGGRYNGGQNFANRGNLAQSGSTPRPNNPRFAAPTGSPTYANYPTSTFTAVTSTTTGVPTTLLFARNTDYRTAAPGPVSAGGNNRFETTARPANGPVVSTTEYNQNSNQPSGGFDLRSFNSNNNNNNNYNNNDNVIYSNHNYNIDVQKTNTTSTVFPVYQNHNYNSNQNNNNQNSNNQNNNNGKNTNPNPTHNFNNNNNNNFNSNNNQNTFNSASNNNNNNQNAFNTNSNSNSLNNNINNKNNNQNNINNNNYYSQFDSQSTKKAIDNKVNTYAANTYAPTTYSPVTKKFANNRVYYDKSTTSATKSVQYTETDSIKSAKKATHFKSSQNGNYETSTKSYDFGRSSVAGFGFSPSSVNHLAENIRSTTPTPRRSAVAVTTYNPNNFNANSHVSQNKAIQYKTTSYQNPSTKQYQTTYSTTSKYFEETTTRPKITKKNDYDYAYYDNLEYDNLELEHVTSNKESVKIS